MDDWFSELVFFKNKKPVIRELCTDVVNPLYPIQFESLMKKTFIKKFSSNCDFQRLEKEQGF